ncbi:hypothetical protein [Legionella birminghamensis]|uniref:hypothetical protein n=1 Tax=Legionella birminghamensis TaxID=28083 RepID=UPI000A46A8BD|nr:hypothetical protein [Legionella birminghamensis]
MSTKTSPTKGSWFFGLGGRDKTTAALYSEILGLLKPSVDNSSEKTPLISS